MFLPIILESILFILDLGSGWDTCLQEKKSHNTPYTC